VGGLAQGISSQDLALVPHLPGGADQLEGVQIEDPFRLGLITKGLMVPAQAEDIANPQGRGPQEVRLQGDPIPVPGDHLQHRVQPGLAKQGAGRQTAEAHHPGLVIGDVDAVRVSFKQFPLFKDGLGVGAFGRSALGGYGEMVGG
jgi:hypothetical protein